MEHRWRRLDALLAFDWAQGTSLALPACLMWRSVKRTIVLGFILLPFLSYAKLSSILGPTGRDDRPENKRVDNQFHASDEILSQSFRIQVAVRKALMQVENLEIALKAERRDQSAQAWISEAGERLRLRVSDIQDQTEILAALQLRHKSTVSQDSAYRSFWVTLSDLNRFSSAWEEKSSMLGYWKNHAAASSDLVEMKRELEYAMEKIMAFTPIDSAAHMNE
jgi:hypothetical protein